MQSLQNNVFYKEIGQITLNFAIGFTIQTLNKNVQTGLIGGAAFATAKMASIVTAPIFKKLGDHGFYALNSLPFELIVATVLHVNPQFSYTLSISLAALRFFLSLGCEKMGISDQHKAAINECLSTSFMFTVITGDYITGLQKGALFAVVAILQQLAHPFFKEKIEQEIPFAKSELNKTKNGELEKAIDLQIKVSAAIISNINILLASIEAENIEIKEKQTKLTNIQQQLTEIKEEQKKNETSAIELINDPLHAEKGATYLLNMIAMAFKTVILVPISLQNKLIVGVPMIAFYSYFGPGSYIGMQKMKMEALMQKNKLDNIEQQLNG